MFYFCILKLSEKVLDINDLSGSVNPMERDNRQMTKDEENDGRAKTKAAEAAKRFLVLSGFFKENCNCAQTELHYSYIKSISRRCVSLCPGVSQGI